MTACVCGGWALFMFNRADEIAPAGTRAQTLPSIPYWSIIVAQVGIEL